jgi:hypothetical protein
MGLAENLAPFADLNGNGTYEPGLGEYPEIRGDHAAYIILNDKGGEHTASGGEPLGIEVHFMFYQFEDAGFKENSTFINVRVINRSTVDYPEFVVGNYMDSDIGFSDDDHGGFDTENNLVYTYNGDLFDEGAGGSPGYGDNPPALGIVGLNHVPAVYCLTHPDPFWSPETPAEYWSLLTGAWDCVEDPDSPSTDRRMFMASPPMALNAGDVVCFDYAIINSRVGTPLENAANLSVIADEAINFHAESTDIYCNYFLSLEEDEQTSTFSVFPNPSNGAFTVDSEGQYDLSIYTMDGRVVYSRTNNNGKSEFNIDAAAGTYILVVENDKGQYTEKLILR